MKRVVTFVILLLYMIKLCRDCFLLDFFHGLGVFSGRMVTGFREHSKQHVALVFVLMQTIQVIEEWYFFIVVHKTSLKSEKIISFKNTITVICSALKLDVAIYESYTEVICPHVSHSQCHVLSCHACNLCHVTSYHAWYVTISEACCQKCSLLSSLPSWVNGFSQ